MAGERLEAAALLHVADWAEGWGDRLRRVDRPWMELGAVIAAARAGADAVLVGPGALRALWEADIIAYGPGPRAFLADRPDCEHCREIGAAIARAGVATGRAA